MDSSFTELNRVVRKRALALIGVLLLAGGAKGQVTSGTIFGTVKDQSGAVVANAAVAANDAATSVSRTVSTNENGEFVVANLPPGTYAITVSATGFKKVEKTNIVLSAADHLNAGDFVLTVGVASEQVTVHGRLRGVAITVQFRRAFRLGHQTSSLTTWL